MEVINSRMLGNDLKYLPDSKTARINEPTMMHDLELGTVNTLLYGAFELYCPEPKIKLSI